MTAGTMFAIWLGELISEFGIRNQGLSLIIFAGIVASAANLARMLATRVRVGSSHLYPCDDGADHFAIVFVQQGRRNVPVMYRAAVWATACRCRLRHPALDGEHGCMIH